VLGEALKEFRRTLDLRSAGVAAELRARCYAALGEPDKVVEDLLASAYFFDLAANPLERTQVICQLEDLAKQDRPQAERQKIREYVDDLKERHYVTRLPDRVLRTFRRLAVMVVLPLTAILAVAMSVGLLAPLVVLETDYAFRHYLCLSEL
jgi:hypothetical protein